MAGIDVDQAGYRLRWCKGEYFSVMEAQNRRINRLIYPVPMAISVGVHVCLDVDRRLRLGPRFNYVNELNYAVDDSAKQDFIDSNLIKVLPFIAPSDLEPETPGIMAMLQGKGKAPRDFVIRHEDDCGLPGFINLIAIETQGLTSSPAIAKYVGRLVDGVMNS